MEENATDLPRLRPGFLTLGRPRPRLRQPQTTWQVLRKRRPGGPGRVAESDRCEIKLTRRLRTVLPVSLRTLRKPSAPTDPGTPLGTTRPGPGRESGTTRGVRLRRKSAYIARGSSSWRPEAVRPGAVCKAKTIKFKAHLVVFGEILVSGLPRRPARSRHHGNLDFHHRLDLINIIKS